MGLKSDKQQKRWRLNMRLLKWTTIILPISLLVLLDWLRHTIFLSSLHTVPGFVAIYVLLIIIVVIFSYAIFGFIERLQRLSDERNQRFEALNNIAKASSASSGLDDIMGASLEIIKQAMKVDAGLICIVDPEKEEHSVVCHSGFSPELIKNIQRAKLKDDPVGLEVVRTGRPVIMERVFEDARVAEMGKREGIRSAISAPLKSEGEVNGILAIATHKERRFSNADQEFLDNIGDQMGLAISKVVLHQQSQLQNQELSALLSVGKVTTSSFDLDELLVQSLDTIIGVTSADAAEIWLKEDNEEIVMRCHRGAHSDAFLEKTRFNLGEGIPGIVAQSGEAILVHDLPSDPRFLRQKVTGAGFHTFYAMPLLYNDKLVGVLAIAALSAEALKEQRELGLLEGIGEWLALATENARLYHENQDLAILQERERIAREMHDGMAQLLGYINTQTIAVKKFLSDGRLKEATEELTKMEEIARDLYADVREGILELRTAAQSKDGFIPALREYITRYIEMFGIQVSIKESSKAKSIKLPPAMEIQLIRIIQEALTNIRKHSGATKALVSVEGDNGHLLTTITDDGHGFDMDNLPLTKKPRFGLHTMRERAEGVGGTLKIHTAPGQGTRVEVQMPVKQQSAAVS